MTSVSSTAGSIIVLDFGGQYAHLIASRIRRFGYRSEIRDSDTPASQLADAAGIILSGGPQSVYEKGSPQADKDIFELGIPVLGICYGHQWIAHALGGKVVSGKTKEYGRMEIEILEKKNTLFQGLTSPFIVWMSHGDTVSELPAGFTRTAQSEHCPVAAMADEKRRIYGVQFHLEVTHTQQGMDILRRFADLCTPAAWDMKSYSSYISEQIKREVGDRKVFMLVSGGVDSTVAFTLLNKVLGTDRVYGLLVDTGLMRKNEIRAINGAMAKLGIDNLAIVDASKWFFDALKSVCAPEDKRKVIGDMFLKVTNVRLPFDKKTDWLLGQGTIYPDTIETGGTKNADKIKTHHNRVEAIQKMIEKGQIIEPLKELYKDEVRMLGEELGLPHELVWRHPFPGPGLGVRILCTSEDSQIPIPHIDIDVPHAVLPIQSVGVQGDGRTYRHAVVLFDAKKVPNDEHWNFATSIPNTNPQFNRVLLCTSHDEPVTFKIQPMGITPERAKLLQDADAIVDEQMRKAGLYEEIWQFPVVLLPVGIKHGGQSIVLRPVHSEEAMTANAVDLPADVLQSMTENILTLPGIDAVFLDLTNKPPGTIEWE